MAIIAVIFYCWVTFTKSGKKWFYGPITKDS